MSLANIKAVLVTSDGGKVCSGCIFYENMDTCPPYDCRGKIWIEESDVACVYNRFKESDEYKARSDRIPTPELTYPRDMKHYNDLVELMDGVAWIAEKYGDTIGGAYLIEHIRALVAPFEAIYKPHPVIAENGV